MPSVWLGIPASYILPFTTSYLCSKCRIPENTKFAIREGGHTVGAGTVIDILD